MKKWGVVIAIAVVIAVIWQAWSLYHGIESKHNQKLAQAATTAKEHYPLKKVLNVTYYHGTKAYDVVKAVNQKGKKVYVWIPDGKGKSLVKPVNQGWSKAKVEQFARDQLHPKKLLGIRLGMEENIPVWEITYIDQKNRYTFNYLRYDNGVWLKNIHLSR